MDQLLTHSLSNNITIITTTIPPNIQQDLMQVFTTLKSSLYLLYLHYKPHVMQYEQYLKLAILALLVYVAYKLGGMTVTDRVESQKQQLRKFIERKNFVQQKVPQQIKKINSNTVKIIILAIVSAGAYTYALNTGHQQTLTQFQTPIIIFSSLTLCYLLYTNLSKLILSNRLKQITKLQQTYSNKLNHFASSLGPKVISILRHHLCRDTLLKFSSSKNISECHKQECRELRSLLKQKNDAIASLVQETVDFEWCSVCKKRLPFDERLHFEALPYVEKSENETEEVKNKLAYLIDGLDRMRKWLAETTPCNCSKLYWTTSTNQVIEFKKLEKQLELSRKQKQQK